MKFRSVVTRLMQSRQRNLKLVIRLLFSIVQKVRVNIGRQHDGRTRVGESEGLQTRPFINGHQRVHHLGLHSTSTGMSLQTTFSLISVPCYVRDTPAVIKTYAFRHVRSQT